MTHYLTEMRVRSLEDATVRSIRMCMPEERDLGAGNLIYATKNLIAAAKAIADTTSDAPDVKELRRKAEILEAALIAEGRYDDIRTAFEAIESSVMTHNFDIAYRAIKELTHSLMEWGMSTRVVDLKRVYTEVRTLERTLIESGRLIYHR